MLRSRIEKRHKASGFTLIELTIVLFLIGTFAMIVLPRFSHVGEGNLGNSTRRLSWTIKYLFNEAALSSKEHRIIFNINEGTYRAAVLEPEGFLSQVERVPELVALKSGVVFVDVSIAGRGSYSDGEVTLRILPSGWVETATVHLKDADSRVQTLRIHPLTGQSTIYEGYRDF